MRRFAFCLLATAFLIGLPNGTEAQDTATPPDHAGAGLVPLRASHSTPATSMAQVQLRAATARLQQIYSFQQLERGVFVGSRFCIACHPSKQTWEGTLHSRFLRRPLVQNSLIPRQGVVADFDNNGVDDFIQGLNFNNINSVFDAFKPNAPILSVENGTYFITVGALKMPVIFTQAGQGGGEGAADEIPEHEGEGQPGERARRCRQGREHVAGVQGLHVPDAQVEHDEADHEDRDRRLRDQLESEAPGGEPFGVAGGNAHATGIPMSSSGRLEPAPRPGEPLIAYSASTYGHGWVREQSCDFDDLVTHSGSIDSYRAQIALLPSRGVGAIVLPNFAPGEPNAIARRALSELARTGALAKRVPRPSPAFPAAMQKLLAVVNQWDAAAYKSMLDPVRGPRPVEDQSELAGYRALHQKYKDGDGRSAFEWDVTLHGPAVGLTIAF